ncbi:histidine phosphatase family protein [Betaproteobacteria bacterium SCN1]|jgi:phosphohistidine phosphatase|nr:histidine phosphatase family protein [Betaproteobacteria bacterium SCN1]MBN8759652.1 histidine phosphatase family protein [Thiobacillus sp.]ODU89643.1 MAG: histidine phosphatase family protein [Thiobacillus sp. SCN 65-179]OJW37571.1 MAG: histidine phosphatase family protein [Thiobacillus sp. 65-69]
MELILWRHAEAEEGPHDLERALTGRGRKQAARMADWLTPRLPPDIRILASPAVRTRQTAQALGRDYAVEPALAPGATAAAVLAAAGWPEAAHPVLVVGHQPTLGRIAARLLAGTEGDVSVKKAGVWWFQCRMRNDELQVVLRAVAGPDYA